MSQIANTHSNRPEVVIKNAEHIHTASWVHVVRPSMQDAISWRYIISIDPWYLLHTPLFLSLY